MNHLIAIKHHTSAWVPAILSTLFIVVAGLGLPAYVIFATDTSTALYSVNVTYTNSSTSDLDDILAAFPLSGAELIAGGFIASDALNTVVQKGGVDIAAMPASDRITIEGAVAADGTSFTEETTEAQSTTTNDVTLLPSTAAVGDAYYWGGDNPFRILTLDIDTAGAGTWELTWEYRDTTAESGWTGFDDVDDQTDAFTTAGVRTVSWDMPTDWVTGTVTGSAVESFWMRARVSSFTSETTQPLGTRARYESGQWVTWVEDLDTDAQEQQVLYFGGATDFLTYHQIFVGDDGVTTGDAAGLELGNAYSFAIKGRIDPSAAGATTYAVNKTSAITINVSGSSTSPAIGTSITGGGTSTGDAPFTMPNTGSQIIIVASDGTNAATWVDATTGGMKMYSVQTVADNGNNWSWATNSGLDYIDWIRLDAVAPTVSDLRTGVTGFVTATHTNTEAFSVGLGLNDS